MAPGGHLQVVLAAHVEDQVIQPGTELADLRPDIERRRLGDRAAV